MTCPPRIQKIYSHGVNLVPLEYRSKHHKASRLKLKSGLTPKTFNVLGFFSDNILYMGVFVVLLEAAGVLNKTANRCRWYRLTMPYEAIYYIGEVTVTHKLLPHQCMITSSNGKKFRVSGHLCGEFTGVNNGEAGDLRRNLAHYDVTLMANSCVSNQQPVRHITAMSPREHAHSSHRPVHKPLEIQSWNLWSSGKRL